MFILSASGLAVVERELCGGEAGGWLGPAQPAQAVSPCHGMAAEAFM